MMLASDVHLGTKNCGFQMERYAYKRQSDGTSTLKPSCPTKRLSSSWIWLYLCAPDLPLDGRTASDLALPHGSCFCTSLRWTMECDAFFLVCDS